MGDTTADADMESLEEDKGAENETMTTADIRDQLL